MTSDTLSDDGIAPLDQTEGSHRAATLDVKLEDARFLHRFRYNPPDLSPAATYEETLRTVIEDYRRAMEDE